MEGREWRGMTMWLMHVPWQLTPQRPEAFIVLPLRFFFQAEDGIRDYKVTGVQTCALPILDYGERLESVDFEAKLETEIFEEILFFDKFKNDLKIEDLKNPEFPNEAYKDLMLLDRKSVV